MIEWLNWTNNSHTLNFLTDEHVLQFTSHAVFSIAMCCKPGGSPDTAHASNYSGSIQISNSRKK